MEVRLKILHYIPDDKFLDSEFDLFEDVAPGCSEWYLWNRNSCNDLKYIKSVSKITGFAPYGSTTFDTLIERCKSGYYTAVMIHACPPKRVVALFNKTPAIIFLCTWGGDVYEMTKHQLLLPLTNTAYKNFKSSGSCLQTAATFLRKTRTLIVDSFERITGIADAYLNVDYICPVIDEDYRVLQQYYGRRLKAKMIEFSYGSGKECTSNFLTAQNLNIVVGNSETWSNNHLDIFHKLREIGVQSEIVCPISYGVNPYLQKLIKQTGQQIFGDKFLPITEFLPYAQYTQKVSSASYMVMGHLRQQAVGNVFIGLRSGAKIFFFERSPLYRFLKRKGFHVFNLESFNTWDDFKLPLTEKQKEDNDSLARSLWDAAAVRAKVLAIIAVIRSSAQ